MLRRWVGLGEDELVVGDGRVRDPVLLAVQDVDVALSPRRRAHRGHVRAGRRLGEPEARELLAAGLRHEVALLLLLARVLEQREGVQPDVDGDQRPECGFAALDLLARERLGDEVEAGTAVLLGHHDPEQAELGHALDDPQVEVVVDVVLDRVRQHALVDECADGALDQALLGGEIEVHGRGLVYARLDAHRRLRLGARRPVLAGGSRGAADDPTRESGARRRLRSARAGRCRWRDRPALGPRRPPAGRNTRLRRPGGRRGARLSLAATRAQRRRMDSAGESFAAGRATGRALRAAGVHVDLAPVLDDAGRAARRAPLRPARVRRRLRARARGRTGGRVREAFPRARLAPRSRPTSGRTSTPSCARASCGPSAPRSRRACPA